MSTTTTAGVTLNDIGSAEDILAAIDKTIKNFNDGDIVEGTIVKVDRDEVLLDIGYKTEGVIPSRELSIKQDIDPSELVNLGDHVEALVLQKEDKEGRLILSKKRAQYERAWGSIEKIKEELAKATEVLTKNAEFMGKTYGVVTNNLVFDVLEAHFWVALTPDELKGYVEKNHGAAAAAAPAAIEAPKAEKKDKKSS